MNLSQAQLSDRKFWGWISNWHKNPLSLHLCLLDLGADCGHLCCLTNATKIYLFIKSIYQNLNLEEFLDFTVRLWFIFRFFSSLYLLLPPSHKLEISWFISLIIKIKTNKRGSSLLVIYIYMECIHPHHLELPKFPSLYANLLSLRCHSAQAGL